MQGLYAERGMAFGKELSFRDCPWCGVRDAHMTALVGDAQAQTARGELRLWTVLSCPRCAGVILLETNDFNEMPPKVKQAVPEDSRAGQQVAFLPDDVARFYADAQRVLDAGVPDAAAVQLRKTLEAAAAHVGIKEGPLVARIEKLIEQGFVTKTFGEVLDRVRKVGNVGAHSSDETVDQATAKQALRFTTQVLRNLFEIPGELRADVVSEVVTRITEQRDENST